MRLSSLSSRENQEVREVGAALSVFVRCPNDVFTCFYPKTVSSMQEKEDVRDLV